MKILAAFVLGVAVGFALAAWRLVKLGISLKAEKDGVTATIRLKP